MGNDAGNNTHTDHQLRTGRLLTGAGLLVFAATVVWFLTVAPGTVPGHFGVDGTVNRWDTKGRFVLTLSAVAVGITLLLTTAPSWIFRLPAGLVNVPNAEYWFRPENRARLARNLTRDLGVVNLIVLLLLSWIMVASVIAADRDGQVSPLFLIIPTLLVAGAVMGLALRIYSSPRYAIPPDDRRS
ncbi:putative membrane protein [Arthrobacter woluwensis]|uniref:hypothetical protein n=1 Tax=Arthrobacter woluwensis TaxID=156980 RepID=UPI002787AC0E|nr:hypothetical protein [Arthrobacter woluwensis]MDQ0710169.1 putative membrane protein [Arthrobacter woluwensis]